MSDKELDHVQEAYLLDLKREDNNRKVRYAETARIKKLTNK